MARAGGGARRRRADGRVARRRQCVAKSHPRHQRHRRIPLRVGPERPALSKVRRNGAERPGLSGAADPPVERHPGRRQDFFQHSVLVYGLSTPDEGEILIDGKLETIASPADALTVAENVALGFRGFRRSSRGALFDLNAVKARLGELSKHYGLSVDPDAYVWQLSVGEQQRIEILKALYRGAALLILDEPTAVLTPQEVDEFFTVLRNMASEGHAIIFISHKLGEVMAYTDRVTVLRDGRNAGSTPTAETSKEALAQMMVGRPLLPQPERPPQVFGVPRLELKNVSAQGDRGLGALKDVSLTVRAGEIMGVAGVSGNGQLELAEVITGLRPVSSGQVSLGETDVTHATAAKRVSQGLSYIPEERNRDGMIRDFSVAENFILRESGRRPFAARGFLDFRAIRAIAQNLVEQFIVKTPSTATPIKNLSGGNAQKVIFVRELKRNPEVLGASKFLREQLLEQSRKGSAVLLISEDLDELLALSHRIAILFHGQLMGVLERDEATVQRIGLLIAGEAA